METIAQKVVLTLDAAVRAPKPPVAKRLEDSPLTSRDRTSSLLIEEEGGKTNRLIGVITQTAHENKVQGRSPLSFPWTDQDIKIRDLFSMTTVFSDDLGDAGVVVPSCFFPVERANELYGEMLNAPELNMEAMIKLIDSKKGEFWSDLYILNLVIREIARGRDSGLKLHPLDTHLRLVVLSRLEQFPVPEDGKKSAKNGVAENGGDWYHFLSQTVFQSALNIRKRELVDTGKYDLVRKIEHATAEGLYTTAPYLTQISRGSKLGSGTHIYPEQIGIKAGKELAKELLK